MITNEQMVNELVEKLRNGEHTSLIFENPYSLEILLWVEVEERWFLLTHSRNGCKQKRWESVRKGKEKEIVNRINPILLEDWYHGNIGEKKPETITPQTMDVGASGEGVPIKHH